jgi:tripartite-type tricarboxylate transporter receptor subunit TctC
MRKWIVAGVALALMAAPAGAQSYPDKPVKIIVPYGAGSVPDVLTRLVAEKMREPLGQPLVVENRAGAGGAIGTAQGAKSPPDGYTITMGGSPAVNAMETMKAPGFHILDDFVPVGSIANFVNVLVVSAKLPVNSVAELNAHIKANPGQLVYAHAGPSTPSHLAGELYKVRHGLNYTLVAYRSSPPAVAAMVGGEAHFSIIPSGVVVGQLQAGTLKALATGTPQRWSLFPNVPNSEEAGLKLTADGWIGLLLPKGTPDAIANKLHGALQKALATPEVKDAAAKVGGAVAPGPRAALPELIKREWAIAKEAVAAAKLEKQ